MLSVYKLSLKPDKEISCFKRIAYKKEELPLSKVLKEGIHPAFNSESYGYGDSTKIRNRMQDVVNEEKLQPPELKQMGYAEGFSSGVYSYSDNDRLKQLLEDIRDKLYFVDTDVRFQDLLEIAKGQLKKKWDREMARDILSNCYREFNDLRSFIKSKKEDVKIPSYESLKEVPLEKILKVEDFLDFEKVLISHGLPIHTFRYAEYLRSITTQEGYISLRPGISTFQFKYPVKGKKVTYNAKLTGDVVVCYPELEGCLEGFREIALSFAETYAKNNKYCPAVPLSMIEELQNQGIIEVYFEGLNYERKEENEPESQAEVKKEAVKYYKIEKFLTESVSANKLREILKQYDEKISGKKEEIIERYADIAMQEYGKLVLDLDKYFAGRKFVKVNSPGHDEDGQEFGVLKDNPIRNLILAMYFIKHLRGNVIFDLGFDNDAYTVRDLAKALIDKKVSLDGGFVKVSGI